MKKLWGGRFSEKTDKLVEEFTQSVSYDQRLAHYDIMGSKAHAHMLAKQQIISSEEADAIVGGLDEIDKEIAGGTFSFDPVLEDVHMNIEARLTERIGEAGGKLHTARSRNDQIATDIRLYLRDVIDVSRELITRLQKVFCESAAKHIDVVMPGYTHLQHAQPVLLAHHLVAYAEMFQRDYDRLSDCRKRVNVLPLGSGALAGSTFNLDREFVAKELGFDKVASNSMDAVSDRDFAVEFSSIAVLIMIHLSRFSEELILWSSQEFSFIELPDAFCTGSSIMPQKKNPDVAELIRGKTGRVLGQMVALGTLLKGLPLAYNRDLQEDKEPLFDVVDTVTASLRVMAEMLPGMKVNAERMKDKAAAGFIGATDLADALARAGVPFRQSHEIIGKLVAECEAKGMELRNLSQADILGMEFVGKYSDVLIRELPNAADPEKGVAARDHLGGTAKNQVQKVLEEYKERFDAR